MGVARSMDAGRHTGLVADGIEPPHKNTTKSLNSAYKTEKAPAF